MIVNFDIEHKAKKLTTDRQHIQFNPNVWIKVKSYNSDTIFIGRTTDKKDSVINLISEIDGRILSVSNWDKLLDIGYVTKLNVVNKQITHNLQAKQIY